MRKIYLKYLIVTAGVFLVSCNMKNPFASMLQPDIHICDLYEQPSVYADSLVELKNVSVTKCSGLLRFYCAEISDGKCSIGLLTNKPFRVGEKVNIQGRFEVVAQDNQSASSVFVDERMQGLKDIVRYFTGI